VKRIFLITLVVILSAFVITADAYAARNSKAEESHDIAITNISEPSSCVQGDGVPVVVKVANQGNCRESFIIRLTDVNDGKEIGTKSAKLSAKDQGGKDVDVTFTGETGGKQYFGDWLDVGDVNGDGYDDLLVSAASYNNEQGRVYLYYGGDPMDNTCDLTFDGENANDWFGRKAAIGGDVNGDNYPDLIIGARRYLGGQEKGRAYLFYGGNQMDNICDKTFTGVSNKNRLGEAVAIFDVDNNGFADVVIGAWGYNAGSNQGRVYTYWGEADIHVTVADKTFTGKPGNARAAFGNFICGGYVNNDNYGDLLIAGFNYYNGDQRGQAYIYYGGTKTSMDEAADRTFTGESPGSQPNRVTLGDVNNDCYDDVIIGGYAYNNGQGRVWLYFGGPGDSTKVTFDWELPRLLAASTSLRQR